jgi:hypothetical protein
MMMTCEETHGKTTMALTHQLERLGLTMEQVEEYSETNQLRCLHEEDYLANAEGLLKRPPMKSIKVKFIETFSFSKEELDRYAEDGDHTMEIPDPTDPSYYKNLAQSFAENILREECFDFDQFSFEVQS